jgi:hypothetical protein
MFRQLTAEPHIHSLLDEWIKQRRITWKIVRTERKIDASMLASLSV